MSLAPIVPRFRHYRGSKENVRRKVERFNATAQRVADHVNKLIANDPCEKFPRRHPPRRSRHLAQLMTRSKSAPPD
jgi:hypothetical protein